MAAITTTAIGVGLSGFQAYQGYKQKKDDEEELNNYERQDLNNAFENVKISTVGSELIREENQRTSANLVDASRQAGIRGILGGIPKIQAFNNTANREAQKYLDDQVREREYSIAGDEVRLRGIREQRDNANIAALSSQIDSGNKDMWNGITGVAKGAIYGANNIDFSKPTTAPTDSSVTEEIKTGSPSNINNNGSYNEFVDMKSMTSSDFYHQKPNNFFSNPYMF